MSKISHLDIQSTITDNLIFLSVYNSKNVKVPSYKLINFLNKGLEISKSRPFISSEDNFIDNKILLSSKTNRLYITTLSPSDIGYSVDSNKEFETKLENFNSILKGDYLTNRNTILNYINSESELTAKVDDCLLEDTITTKSALKNVYNKTLSGNSDSVAAFIKEEEGNNYVLGNINLNANIHKKYFIAKHKATITSAIENMGIISSLINEEMIEIQKKITQKVYSKNKQFYPWKLTEDARSNPADHLKFITKQLNAKLKAEGLELKFNEGDIDKSVDTLDDKIVDESLSINLAKVVADIRYKMASSSFLKTTTGASKYSFKKIYDLYSAGQEIYDVLKKYFGINIDSAPEWKDDYTQYLDYATTTGWGTVTVINNLQNLDNTNFIDYDTMFK
jgi:hypothetical protein